MLKYKKRKFFFQILEKPLPELFSSRRRSEECHINAVVRRPAKRRLDGRIGTIFVCQTCCHCSSALRGRGFVLPQGGCQQKPTNNSSHRFKSHFGSGFCLLTLFFRSPNHHPSINTTFCRRLCCAFFNFSLFLVFFLKQLGSEV